MNKYQRALSKAMHDKFKHIEDYDCKAAYYVDEETNDTYTWIFHLEGRKYKLVCEKSMVKTANDWKKAVRLVDMGKIRSTTSC